MKQALIIVLGLLAAHLLIAGGVWFVGHQRVKNAGEVYGLLTWSERKCSPGTLAPNAARELLAYREVDPAGFDRATYQGRIRGEKAYRVYEFDKFCELVVDPYQKALVGFWMPSLTGPAWSDNAHWSEKKPPKTPDVAPEKGATLPPPEEPKENYFDKFGNAPPSTRVFTRIPAEGDPDPFAPQGKPATPPKD